MARRNRSSARLEHSRSLKKIAGFLGRDLEEHLREKYGSGNDYARTLRRIYRFAMDRRVFLGFVEDQSGRNRDFESVPYSQ